MKKMVFLLLIGSVMLLGGCTGGGGLGAQRFRTDFRFGGSRPENDVQLINSFNSLQEVIADLRGLPHASRQPIIDHLEEFDEEFFENFNIIMLSIISGSGSIDFNILGITNEGVINIGVSIPEIITEDMAFWTFVIVAEISFNPNELMTNFVYII